MPHVCNTLEANQPWSEALLNTAHHGMIYQATMKATGQAKATGHANIVAFTCSHHAR